MRRAVAPLLVAALSLLATACGAGGGTLAASHGHGSRHGAAGGRHGDPTTTTKPSLPTTTTTTGAAPTTTTGAPATTSPPTTAPAPPPSGPHGPVTEPPLPAPGAGYVADQVTAIGDSVMLDYQGALAADIPGVHVTAAVSRWWTTGEAIVDQLESQDALGAVVIIGLGTNGPVSAAQFDSMMSALSGASRVVIVNNRVDRTWQDPNNTVLAQGVARYPRAVLVDWYSLAVQNPGWLYPTQTHLPIDGPGADALAALVAAAA